MISAFVINLDKDKDRLEALDARLGALGISYTRVPGVWGTQFSDDLKPYFCLPNGELAETPLAAGEIGAYASHLRAMKMIVDQNLPYGLIFEDDALPLPSLVSTLNQIEKFPAGWDIIRLCGLLKRSVAPLFEIEPGTDFVFYSRIPLGAAAYLVSNAGARNFLADRGPRVEPLDVEIARHWFYDLKVFGVVPRPVKTTNAPSTIESVAGRDSTHSIKRKAKIRGSHYVFERSAQALKSIREMGFGAWATCFVSNTGHHIAKIFGAKRKIIE